MKIVTGRRYADGKLEGVAISNDMAKKLVGELPRGHTLIRQDNGLLFSAPKENLSLVYPTFETYKNLAIELTEENDED